ncbi:MAG: SUMF1/EgtB/PvdO family nonheme iron enzyme [Acidobacteriota bacterium]|jgi:formylglycine-generating enzyme required for sulfatase activity/plastocyanin|nr:SUMF1/EgtB/PvdO family nonheme iron enzyme [Acidobacteriota bacterium]
MTTSRRAGAGAAVLVLAFLTACGDGGVGGGGGWSDIAVKIAISPQAGSMTAGESKVLTVTATNTGFEVSVNPPADYERVGNDVVFTPVSRGTYTVTATATANTSKKASAAVTVTLADPEVAVAPGAVKLAVGDTIQFAANTSSPVGQPQSAPSWEVSGGCGSIDRAGLFTATAKGSCTVVASVLDIDDKQFTAVAAVTVTLAAPEVSIAPTAETLAVGNTIQFAAHAVLPVGQPQSVPSWEVSGGCGSIDRAGLFTATAKGSCTVVASVLDIDGVKVSAAAGVTVTLDTPAISVAPASMSLAVGDEFQFAANTSLPTGQPQSAPSWEVSGGCGSIDRAGLFTATAKGSCAVTASVLDIDGVKVSAEAGVTVTLAAPEIAVAPEAVLLTVGDEFQFAARTVLPVGQPQSAPSWEVSGGCGSIDRAGLFTATSGGSCTVVASVLDIDGVKVSSGAAVTVTEPRVEDLPGMRFVEGGTFTMGCTAEQGGDCDADESPAHPVTLSSFYIGITEVTQAQWKAVMGSNPSAHVGDSLPVENVSWNDVQEFLEKLNEREAASGSSRVWRLPTEAEWEFAARGGVVERKCDARYDRCKYSGAAEVDDVAWFADNSGGAPHGVGTKAANDLWLNDMSGNVWEWCQDRYGAYDDDAQKDPAGPATGPYRVIRGGNWSADGEVARVSNRAYGYPDNRDGTRGTRGFRLASSWK